MTARPELEPGLLLAGRYHLRTPLGHGGAGTVWRADDDVLDRPVAVKLLHPELERDTSAVVRFRREATSAAALTHPNAVIVYDIGDAEGRIFLVMELVDGPTLSDLLATGPLPAPEVAALGGAVSRALGAAHERDLVHRDVKPGNVLVTREGVAKMADFGIATALGDAQARLTTPGMVVGTSTYLAPEQLTGDDVDGRADVYSLGLVLHECLTGEAAFSGGTAVEVATRRLAGDVPPPSRRVSGVPEELDLVIQKATRREPAERWRHGADLAAALLALAPEDPSRRLAALIQERVGPPEQQPARGPDTVAQPAWAPAGPSAAAQDGTEAADEPSRGVLDDQDTSSTTAIPATSAGVAGGAPTEPPTGTVPARWDDEADDEPGPDGPVVERGSTSGWRPVLLGLVVVALAGLGLVGFLGGDGDLDPAPEGVQGDEATDGDDEGGDGDDEESGAFEPVDASDFDPFGDGEHASDVPNAHDGDPDTSWQTQSYNSAAFGNLKPGVGIYFDLGEPAAVRELTMAMSPAGAQLEVYAGDAAPSTSGDFDPSEWGDQIAAIDGADTEVNIELEDVEQQVWLLWFTSLPADGGGHQVSLSEVGFHG